MCCVAKIKSFHCALKRQHNICAVAVHCITQSNLFYCALKGYDILYVLLLCTALHNIIRCKLLCINKITHNILHCMSCCIALYTRTNFCALKRYNKTYVLLYLYTRTILFRYAVKNNTCSVRAELLGTLVFWSYFFSRHQFQTTLFLQFLSIA